MPHRITYIRLEVPPLKFDFKINDWRGSLNLKNSTIYNKISTKQLFPHFVLKVGLFVEKFQEHKSLFKLDGSLTIH